MEARRKTVSGGLVPDFRVRSGRRFIPEEKLPPSVISIAHSEGAPTSLGGGTVLTQLCQQAPTGLGAPPQGLPFGVHVIVKAVFVMV